jgi:hypothetical protein
MRAVCTGREEQFRRYCSDHAERDKSMFDSEYSVNLFADLDYDLAKVLLIPLVLVSVDCLFK